MTDNKKILLWGGGALAIGVLVWLWYSAQGQTTTTVAPDGSVALNLPAGATQTYSPAAFTVPALTTSSGVTANPAGNIIFDFNSGAVVPAIAPPGGAPPVQPPSNGNSSCCSACDTGSADGSTGACNCPGASTTAYGNVQAQAAALVPALGTAYYDAANAYPPSVAAADTIQTLLNLNGPADQAAKALWQWNPIGGSAFG